MAKPKKENKLSLEQAMAQINKTYGSTSIFKGSENIAVQVETRSSGCLSFDYALGLGAIPRGRIIEIAGAESSGKTVFSLSVIAFWQKNFNAKCVFVDAEQALSPAWAKSLGVDWENLIYTAPDTLEQALDIIDTLASTGEVDLICFDSVAAAPSSSEAEKTAGDVLVGALAKVLTSALRKITPVLSKNKCTLICINQLREKIGGFNPTGQILTTSPGGRALRHAAALRLEMRKIGGSDIKQGNITVGHKVKIKCKKNKLSSSQGAEAEFTLYYKDGIDFVEDAISVSTKVGVVERPNNRTYIFGDLKVVGYENFVEQLKKDKQVLNQVVKATQDKMMSGVVFIEEETENIEDIENMEIEE